MSTSYSNINYPPIVDSSIPAFIKEGLTNFTINFRVPLVVNYSLVRYIAIKISKQGNSQSIYKQYDNILYIPCPKQSDDNGNFSISYKELENRDYIKDLEWEENEYYKIQIAFGYNEDNLTYSTVESFYEWKSHQKMSEWSNVIITRLITKPEIKILNNFDSRKYTSDIIKTISHNTELNLQPVFEASYFNQSEEPLYQYKFDLYDDELNLLETSDWVVFDNKLQNITALTYIFSYKFKRVLKENKIYKLYLSVLTKNNYLETLNEPYEFSVVETVLSEKLNYNLYVLDNARGNYPRTDENASLEIYLETDTNISGIYYLLRTSEQTDFLIWEDLAKFEFFDSNEHKKSEIGNDTKDYLLYEDFTIESGIKYKYALQKENQSKTRRTAMLEAKRVDEPFSIIVVDENGERKEETIHYFISNFQNTYLYCNGIQLRLNFDAKIQSFKRTRLAQKQDGLNSKYPIIIRNGMTDYAEFQLAGKISLHSDEYDSFFYKRHSVDKPGYYYNNDLLISSKKYCEDSFINDYSIITFDANPTDNNIFMERIYRTYVEKFLNNNEYKLFKSPTEGNYIVTLFNVSLTPNQQLSRMIADFSSTAYEVAENTLNSLKEYNINPLNVKTNRMRLAQTGQNSTTRYSIGQIRGALDGVYKKAFKINKNVYADLLDNNFKPYNYFYQEENDYISNNQITPEIINYLSAEKNINIQHINNTFFNSTEDDIITQIKQQEETVMDNEKKWKVKNIVSLTFEIYPKYNVEQEIFNLQSLLDSSSNDMTYLEKLQTNLQIAKYNLVLQSYNENQNYPISLTMNGRDTEFMPGRTYHLENINIDSLYLKYTRPILINYIVEKEVVDADLKYSFKEVSRKQVINVGQLYGIFTNKDSNIIRNHDKLNFYDIVNYKIYPDLNITNSIKKHLKDRIYLNYGTTLRRPVQELREQIENLLNKDTLINMSYEEQVSQMIKLIDQYRVYAEYEKAFENDEWDIWESPSQNIIEYELTGLDTISIETDKNVSLTINESGQKRNILIGPTSIYSIDTSDRKVSSNLDFKTFDFDIAFNSPSFGLVNYQADVLIKVLEKIQS